MFKKQFSEVDLKSSLDVDVTLLRCSGAASRAPASLYQRTTVQS